jgi:carboxypeptidase Taq
MTQERYEELRTRLSEISDLHGAIAVLSWDQSTYMPAGGAEARGRQLATLQQLAHEKFIDPAMGTLLESLASYEDTLPEDSDERRLIAVTRRDYDRTTRVPASFMADLANHSALAYQAWAEARPANNWEMVQPFLEKTLDFSRRYAEFFPDSAHIADPLIDGADEGMTVEIVRGVFGQLREQLVPMVKAITAQPVADDACLHQNFPRDKQWEIGLEMIRRFGYDFERGRQDFTAHPFMTSFSTGDVRITTRMKDDDLGDGLFSTLHEAGHALYEQGIRRDYEATPLASGTSSGVHESQSRLWENLVGRSRPFWEHWYGRLQEVFPQQLGDTPLDTFYRAINKVQPSLIRTDADEVTYNLHVMLRFDLELDLLEGRLAIRDLPEAWNARYQSDLQITPPDNRDGVLQDVHWYAGLIGGSFQGYTLGNILSAQFYQTALDQNPQIAGDVAAGSYDSLRSWMTDNIYQHGRKYTPTELIQRVTGRGVEIAPYVSYLRSKYRSLYSL